MIEVMLLIWGRLIWLNINEITLSLMFASKKRFAVLNSNKVSKSNSATACDVQAGTLHKNDPRLPQQFVVFGRVPVVWPSTLQVAQSLHPRRHYCRALVPKLDQQHNAIVIKNSSPKLLISSPNLTDAISSSAKAGPWRPGKVNVAG